MEAYSQQDPAWAGKRLGLATDGETIGPYGCFVTAFANILRWAGGDMNPAQVNDQMIERGMFWGALVNNQGVPAILRPDLLDYLGATQWTGATDMNFFNDASDPNVAYIIYIDASPAPGMQSHFTMVWNKEGADDLNIVDSWDGNMKRLSAYGTPSAIIYGAYKFVKKAATPAPTPEPAGDPEMAHPTRDEVVVAYQNISGREPTEDEISLQMSKGSYKSLIQGFFEGGDTAVAKYKAAQTDVNRLADENSNLQQELVQANHKINTSPSPEAFEELQKDNDALTAQLAKCESDLKAAQSTAGTGNGNILGDFLVRLTSRKFLAAVVAGFVTLGNFAFGWHLDVGQLLASITPFMVYIGVEGWRDAKAAQ